MNSFVGVSIPFASSISAKDFSICHCLFIIAETPLCASHPALIKRPLCTEILNALSDAASNYPFAVVARRCYITISLFCL